MIPRIRIIADDLTGALDAAAPFASPERPVEVPWLCRPKRESELVAATSESRNMEREGAILRTLQTFERLLDEGAHALWFKKVDSVLRGQPVAETAALIQAGRFRRCVFAPAFPEMGRITRGGRQILSGPEGEHLVGPPDLVAAFAQEGLTAALSSGPAASYATVLIAEAETSEDLARTVRAVAGPMGILWSGSRGLAAALAGLSSPRPPPPIGLIIVGTSHPATRAQVRAVEAHVTRVASDGPVILDSARPLLIDPVPNAFNATETRTGLQVALDRLELPSDRQIGLVIVGGDTLSTVLEVTQTGTLEVLGEVTPGIPLVRARGGRLDDRCLVTKSGGFGSPDLLLNLLKGPVRGVS